MRTACIIIGLFIVTSAHTQDPAGAEWIMQELMENDQPGEAEELYATVTRHIEQPVDLNNCTREELTATGIFTPFQVFAIMDQRERYGPFFSIFELAAIPGINREFLEEIRLMITFSEDEQPAARQYVNGMLLTNVAYRSPPASGMRNTDQELAVYQGDPLKFTQRIRVDYGDKLTLGAAFEKDPGEPWTNRQRPEHLTGYLACAPGKFIEQLVVGNFRIHRGMGLVHRLGFSSRSTGSALNGYRRSYGKPFASTLEYDYFRGVYASASKSKWDLDMFLSHTPADISFFRLEDKEELFGMTRQTGLHRTTSEREGFDLASLSSLGASLNRSGKKYYAGCSFSAAQMQLTQRGIDSLKFVDPLMLADPLKTANSPKISNPQRLAAPQKLTDSLTLAESLKSSRSAVSLYGVAFGTNYELFGEVALDNTLHGAAFIGGSLVINPAFSAEASFKRLSPGYRGVMPGTEDAKDDVYDLRLGLRIAPFSNGRIIAYHNLTVSGQDALPTEPRFPERYSAIEFSYGARNGPAVTLRYTGKTTREINTGTRSGIGTITGQQQQHFRIQYRWEAEETVILQGRIEISALSDLRVDGTAPVDEPRSENATGSMVYQQVQWIPREGIRITYRYLLFDIGDWENRIYTYEPGVKYSFLFPAWVGKGSRNVLVTSAKISRRITLRGKCGLTVYAHRWETGSGNDVRNGNRLIDLELQLQANLF